MPPFVASAHSHPGALGRWGDPFAVDTSKKPEDIRTGTGYGQLAVRPKGNFYKI